MRCRPYTKYRFMPPISSIHGARSRRARPTWSQPCSAACGLGDQGGGVVAAGLGVAGAAGDGAHVVLGEPDGDRLDAAGEVGAGRGGDHDEEVLVGGPDAEADLGRDHERPQVEGLPRRRARAPSPGPGWTSASQASMNVSTGSSGIASRRAEAWKRSALALGAEGGDGAVGLAVGLEALEDRPARSAASCSPGRARAARTARAGRRASRGPRST